MNTIEVVNNRIISNIDDSLELDVIDNTNLLSVKKIVVNVIKSTDLIFKFKNKELEKWMVVFNIHSNCKFNLFELKEGIESKTQYNFYLDTDSEVFHFKFNNIKTCKERTIINLNGDRAKMNYQFKTISEKTEDYDFIINHNASNTESNLSAYGVNIKQGVLNFNITGDVLQDKRDCIINEDSRIINLTDHKCVIKPNLLVEEYSVSANHSAFIGNFSKEELFYLESRGIPRETAINLLIKGFLLSNLQMFDFLREDLEKIINKYWR